jgi:hypothetical protein
MATTAPPPLQFCIARHAMAVSLALARAAHPNRGGFCSAPRRLELGEGGLGLAEDGGNGWRARPRSLRCCSPRFGPLPGHARVEKEGLGRRSPILAVAAAPPNQRLLPACPWTLAARTVRKAEAGPPDLCLLAPCCRSLLSTRRQRWRWGRKAGAGGSGRWWRKAAGEVSRSRLVALHVPRHSRSWNCVGLGGCGRGGTVEEVWVGLSNMSWLGWT